MISRDLLVIVIFRNSVKRHIYHVRLQLDHFEIHLDESVDKK